MAVHYHLDKKSRSVCCADMRFYFFSENPSSVPSGDKRCSICHFRIRGSEHEKGKHHNNYRRTKGILYTDISGVLESRVKSGY